MAREDRVGKNVKELKGGVCERFGSVCVKAQAADGAPSLSVFATAPPP